MLKEFITVILNYSSFPFSKAITQITMEFFEGSYGNIMHVTKREGMITMRWEVVLPLIIIVLGWLANHKLSIKAQEKKFLNDIKNEARLKISESIREYQEWLSEVETYFTTLDFTLNKPKIGLEIDWQDEYERYRKITTPATHSWNWLLEEYRILFPETAKVRVILQRRNFEISQMILWFSMQFWQHNDLENDIPNKFLILNEMKKWLNYISDQSCLVYDLRIYLQNRTLKEITGNSVPERKPLDKRFCRVVLKGENLEVVDGEGNIINHTKLPFSPHNIWEYPLD